MRAAKKKTKRNRTIVIAAGGTSGHINPALAIAAEIVRRDPACHVIFCGKNDSLEEEMVGRAGFEFVSIRARWLPSIHDLHYFSWFRENSSGYYTAKKLLKHLNPALVIGTGGFVSAPVIFAAKKLRIPYILHEQNFYPGRANRMLAKGAMAVYVCHEKIKKYFERQDNIIVSGNPVRQIFYDLDKETSRQKLGLAPEAFIVVITGGSLGANSINHAVIGLSTLPEFQKLAQEFPDFKIFLSTGKESYETVKASIPACQAIEVTPYIYNLNEYMAASDLIISRAGAMTCAEIMTLHKPAILVPYPYAAGDHQTYNARFLSEIGAAIICNDADFDAEFLFVQLKKMINNPEHLLKAEKVLTDISSVKPVEIIYENIARALAECE